MSEKTETREQMSNKAFTILKDTFSDPNHKNWAKLAGEFKSALDKQDDLISKLQSQLSAEKAKVLELERPLKWLFDQKRGVNMSPSDGTWHVEDFCGGYGNNPLEAIQNAMSKDKSD